MKMYIYGFLTTSALTLAIAPAVNIYNDLTGEKIIVSNPTGWVSKKNLYNLDFILPPFGLAYRHFGISIAPRLALNGKDGWMFLGDRYANTLTETRGLTPFNQEKLDLMAANREKWNSYIKSLGGKGYVVTVAPNSQSIYPEKLPDWVAQSSSSKSIGYFLSHADKDRTLIDLSTELKNNVSKSKLPLFYKTDTHWNKQGAWYGYQKLATSLSHDFPDLKWLTPTDVSFTQEIRPGGDMSRFQHIQEKITDTEIKVNIDINSQVTVKDWSGETLRSVGLSDGLSEANSPLHIYSSGALNKMKVLWLRDSFGIALYPYMNATFSEIMERHFDAFTKKPEDLKELIRTYQPDIVIITVIERSFSADFFMMEP